MAHVFRLSVSYAHRCTYSTVGMRFWMIKAQNRGGGSFESPSITVPEERYDSHTFAVVLDSWDHQEPIHPRTNVISLARVKTDKKL